MSDRGKFGGAFALGVSSCMVGVREIPGAGWRVVLKIGEEAMHMPSSEAREMAKTFETPFARKAGFGEVGDKLRELADECDQLRGIRWRE